jgi:hypothetical protein
MSEVRKIIIDSGREGKYRVIADLDWCEEHQAFEHEIIHRIRSRHDQKKRAT